MPVKRTMGRKTTTPAKKKTESSSESESKTLSSSQVVKVQTEVLNSFSKMTDADVINILYHAGVGSKYFTCQMCGQVKTGTSFYKSTDLRMRTGVSNICSECLSEIANGANMFGKEHGYSKASLCQALEYFDRPFLNEVYDQAELESQQATGKKAEQSMWTLYINIIKGKKYAGLRWRDSDGVQKSAGYDVMVEDTEVETPEEDVIENQEQYEINRRDTMKFCGYDPFVNEDPSDKPRLYAKLVGFLDDQAKEDPFKLSSIIEIVKGLSQSEKINDEITALLNNKATLIDNNAVLNKLMDTRKKCLDTVQTLARDNGISINFNKNSSAGQQTLSGRIKKVTEEKLREGQVNLFDIGTCEGMRQIAEISEAARAKQLGFNEDIAREIKDTSTALVTGLTKERDEYKERCRILLRENLDLKDFLRDRNLIDEHNVAVNTE